MMISPWLAILVGVLLCAASGLILLLLPETLELTRQADREEGIENEASQSGKATIVQKTLDIARESYYVTKTFILGNKRVVMLMLPLCFFIVGRYAQELLLQYATKRYNWSWSKVRDCTWDIIIRPVNGR